MGGVAVGNVRRAGRNITALSDEAGQAGCPRGHFRHADNIGGCGCPDHSRGLRIIHRATEGTWDIVADGHGTKVIMIGQHHRRAAAIVVDDGLGGAGQVTRKIVAAGADAQTSRKFHTAAITRINLAAVLRADGGSAVARQIIVLQQRLAGVHHNANAVVGD